jgi:hypothetical protein
MPEFGDLPYFGRPSQDVIERPVYLVMTCLKLYSMLASLGLNDVILELTLNRMQLNGSAYTEPTKYAKIKLQFKKAWSVDVLHLTI